MPDHFHWLFRLGARLSLGRCLARFKAQTRASLSAQQIEWQRDFFEHRLRAGERAEAYGLYIFLNPYRASLIRPDQKWLGWYGSSVGRFDFAAKLNEEGTPLSAWIEQPVPAQLMTGE